MKKIKIILLIISISFLSACSKNAKKTNEQNMLEDKKILMVIAPKDFRDQEYFDPRNVFDQNKIKVDVGSIQTGLSIGADGGQVKIDKNISEIEPKNYDAVVFIGGPGMDQIKKDESLRILAQKFYKEGKLVTAICVAPYILANGGLLESRNATSWSGVKDFLTEKGAKFENKNVVVAGNIITASGPEAAQEFGETIINQMK